MREFPAHGGMSRAYREGRIIHVFGGGATNLEAMAGYHQALLSLVAELGGSSWGVLAHIDEEALLIPEAEDLMRDGAVRLTAAGRVAVAFVLPHAAMRAWVRAQWARIFKDAGCAFDFFDTQAEARTWLDERLAEDDAVRGKEER